MTVHNHSHINGYQSAGKLVAFYAASDSETRHCSWPLRHVHRHLIIIVFLFILLQLYHVIVHEVQNIHVPQATQLSRWVRKV